MTPGASRAVSDPPFGLSFVARPRAGLTPVAIGDELVLLDGWDLATCLNPTGALLWSTLDGRRSIGEIAAELGSTLGVPQAVISADLSRFLDTLALQGLLDGIEPAVEELDVHLQEIPARGEGDEVEDLRLRHLDGQDLRLSDLSPDGTVLLVNWNPHCGYCARIAHELADLQQALAAADCVLVLASRGSVEANRNVAGDAGLVTPIVVLADDQDPFRGAGTPSAYHLGSDRRIIVPPAYGADQVLELARAVAGVDEATAVDAAGEPVRYLLDRDGLCGQDWHPDTGPVWTGTCVYRVRNHHVGIRYDSPGTAGVLDRLLGDPIEDPRAGHSFSVALGASPSTPSSPAPLKLLVQPGQPTLRSRDASRVLAALLARLSEGTTSFDEGCGRIQVDAIAALHPNGAALLPWGLHGFDPRLQPLLAREGIALADARHPEIDLETLELVIPEPVIDHDPEVVSSVASPSTSPTELVAVSPGRYPLISWCVIHPGATGAPGATRLSPAEAAAATLSTVLHTVDAPDRLRQLGRLFASVSGFALWYYSEAEMIAAVVEALTADAPPLHGPLPPIAAVATSAAQL
jgi:peroxiredoxin